MNIVKIRYKDFTAEVNLSRGANCISLKNDKKSISILREPDYEKGIDNPFVYGMPVLFPVNRISGGGFEFEGRQYRFPINEPGTNCHVHGFLHMAEFEIADHGESFVRCIYTSDELYEYFPHEFSVEIAYTLDENGLTQETTVRNLSHASMPVFIGFHTTFNIPFAGGSRSDNIRLYAQVSDEIERDASSFLPTGGILPCDDVSCEINAGTFMPYQNKISRHYKADKQGKTELIDVVKGIKICYENGRNLGWRLFYNADADRFICLEPQSCMVDCANSPFGREYAGFDYIEPGSCKKYISRIYMEECHI